MTANTDRETASDVPIDPAERSASEPTAAKRPSSVAACDAAAQTAPFGAKPPSQGVRVLTALTATKILPQPVRARLRRRIRPLLPRRPIDIALNGLKLRLVPGDNKVDDDILMKRRLDEPEERAFVRRMLRPGDLMVDVGANIGIATLDALVNGPPGVTAIALEPHPVLFARLTFNIAANVLGARASLHPVAAGPSEGRATLHASSGFNAGRSSLKPFSGNRPDRFDVPLRPLASLLTEAGAKRIGVLKIDVEGTEDGVLLPFLQSAPDSLLPRAVVMETVHRDAWQMDCLTALVERGYCVAETTEENTMLHRTAEAC